MNVSNKSYKKPILLDHSLSFAVVLLCDCALWASSWCLLSSSEHGALDSAVMISLIKESSYLLCTLTDSPLREYLPVMPEGTTRYVAGSLL